MFLMSAVESAVYAPIDRREEKERKERAKVRCIAPPPKGRSVALWKRSRLRALANAFKR